MVYSAKIKFIEDGSVLDVLISEVNDIENLPNGLIDKDIFFYGMSHEQARRALLTQELCEGEWIIIALDYLTTVGEMRPCVLEDEDVVSGSTVPDDKAQF